MESIYEQFARFVWSYYIIDGLIADPDISDIRITDASHVYIKKRGVRSLSGVRFESADDYERFIERVALKNKVNMAVRVVSTGTYASHKKTRQKKEAFSETCRGGDVK